MGTARRAWTGMLAAALVLLGQAGAAQEREFSRAELLDRIHGAWLGQLIGNLQGLPHEFKYMEKPRAELPEFTCGLPDGAWSDDDTDIEWVVIDAIDRGEPPLIPYPRLRRLWLANMNDGIWVANRQARGLMFRGLVPPWTGHAALNPHAGYNLSGQFAVETYGIVAPGLPRTAADLGLHYARVAVSGEPLQAAQYWTSLVALAYVHEGPLPAMLAKALAAVDPASVQAEAVQHALTLFRKHPADWKAARQEVHERWVKPGVWNANATPPNAALVVLALLYGDGDFKKSLQYAFALGYDADCNTATVGTVLGARIGLSGLRRAPGFVVKDLYVNRTRAAMPRQVTISSQAEQLLRVAEKVIRTGGGQVVERGGTTVVRLKVQTPQCREACPPKLTPSREKVEQLVLDLARAHLKSADTETRLRGALVLAHLGGRERLGDRREEVTTVLWEHARDEDVTLRLAALGGLVVLGEERAVEGFLQAARARKLTEVTAADVRQVLQTAPEALRPRLTGLLPEKSQ